MGVRDAGVLRHIEPSHPKLKILMLQRADVSELQGGLGWAEPGQKDETRLDRFFLAYRTLCGAIAASVAD